MSNNKYEIPRLNPTEDLNKEGNENIYTLTLKWSHSHMLGRTVPVLELMFPYSESQHSDYLKQDFEKNFFLRRVGKGNGDSLIIRIEDYPATSGKRNLSDILYDNGIKLDKVPRFAPEDSINAFGKRKQDLNNLRLFYYNEPKS